MFSSGLSGSSGIVRGAVPVTAIPAAFASFAVMYAETVIGLAPVMVIVLLSAPAFE